MTRIEEAEFLQKHLEFLQATAEDAAKHEFYGDVPEISKQILATIELIPYSEVK